MDIQVSEGGTYRQSQIPETSSSAGTYRQSLIPVTSSEIAMVDDHLYSAILRSLEQTHCARLWFCMSDKLFIGRF